VAGAESPTAREVFADIGLWIWLFFLSLHNPLRVMADCFSSDSGPADMVPFQLFLSVELVGSRIGRSAIPGVPGRLLSYYFWNVPNAALLGSTPSLSPFFFPPLPQSFGAAASPIASKEVSRTSPLILFFFTTPPC